MARSLIDILDLSEEEIDSLIETAQDIMQNREMYSDLCHGKKLATLFYEPSTRTRLSFEAAMLELGGNVLGFSEAQSSSASKGESVGDTARIVSCYADIIVMRHPLEGAPMAASACASVPVINAGDGGHYHPTQTLTDLMTIKLENGRLNNLTVAFCGDLKYGRTVHSLISALSRYEGIRLLLVSPPELRLPDYVKNGVIMKNDMKFIETTSLDEALPEADVLYMTRIQGERFADKSEYERLKGSYVLDAGKMKSAKCDMRVLHPLPRVDEISREVDDDDRACYFRQALYGKYIRMALIRKLLFEPDVTRKREYEVGDKRCSNSRCISFNEKDLSAAYYTDGDGKRHCAYCENII